MMDPISSAKARLLNLWFFRGSHAVDHIIGPSRCFPFRRPLRRFPNYARDALGEFRNLSLEIDIQLASREALSIKKIFLKIIELTVLSECRKVIPIVHLYPDE